MPVPHACGWLAKIKVESRLCAGCFGIDTWLKQNPPVTKLLDGFLKDVTERGHLTR